ncbi:MULTISPECIES: inositol monophosphatase family protein [Comamonadaceae]|jgi:fructose-1,6-bisphosphatase/inositol monophosphatase family enzyme|nr:MULTISPECIES: inositol monophosphatase [Comamonadaceae]OJX31111.1 MAG: inositol monophosphatase [Burkholderiales bacterium 68-12]SFE85122.1 fructose-1,6-bisphosphatase [Paracidovorax wautersii]GAO20697.1 2-dehydropantoate 2-reductase [Alicycliphilus sp. B1]MDR7093006.1 fructose-1,6-bisphosphatase/inositol monophosphatase family enzyme [Hydrogenophaga laconesensis]NCU65438.1 inositol monophosphatase [Acidovorax sp. 210-6]
MAFSMDDLLWMGKVLQAAGQAELMPRFNRLAPDQIARKTSAFDVVTLADERSEAAIASDLARRFPGALIVGEEAAGRDPELLERIGGRDLAFVVDPLDGTRNFASGLPLFGVMAAAVVRGEIMAGAIHDPVTGSTAYAFRSGGAWLEHEGGGRRIDLRVAAPVPPDQMDGVIGTNFLPEPLRTRVNQRLSSLSTTCWLRCAAHEYRLAAAGQVHALFYNKLMPWDHAAGWLLHREAGGHSAHFDGSPFLPAHMSGGLICAPDARSWRDLKAALLD